MTLFEEEVEDEDRDKWIVCPGILFNVCSVSVFPLSVSPVSILVVLQ